MGTDAQISVALAFESAKEPVLVDEAMTRENQNKPSDTVKLFENLRARRPTLTDHFVDYAWNDFDASRVIALLTAEEEQFRFQRNVLYAALCAWVISPHNPKLRKRAITTEAARLISDMESLSSERYDGVNQLGDIYVRVAIAPDFFDEVYYPIGGLKQILTHGRNSKAPYVRLRSSIRNIVALMSLHHYHAINFSKEEYFPPSLNKSAGIVTNISLSLGSTAEVKRDWAALSTTCMMVYAAEHTRISDKKTLLDDMQSGLFSSKHHQPSLIEWLGRVRFIQEEIMPRVSLPLKHNWLSLDLSNVEKVPVPNPSIPETAEADMKKDYYKG